MNLTESQIARNVFQACKDTVTLPHAGIWLFLLSHVLLQRGLELLPRVRHGAAYATGAGHRDLPALLLPHLHQT